MRLLYCASCSRPFPSQNHTKKMSASTVNVNFSERVNKLINELMPPKDVFDEAQFDSASYMNSTFPEEETLVGLDVFIAKLRRNIAQVDRDLLRAVKTESMIGGKPDDDLAAARQTVGKLIGEVDNIKQKARKIDDLADSIGKDVRSLDAAKQNLGSSIAALRNLADLEEHTNTLQTALDSGDYLAAAEALKEARDLLKLFEPHRSAPRIAALSRRMDLFTSRLYAHATKHAWPNLDPTHSLEDNVVQLGLSLARALGPVEFVKHFNTHQIDNYRMAFKLDPPALGEVQRRFDWLWNLYRGIEDYIAPPAEWFLQQELAVDFCVQTTHDLQEQLEQEKCAGRLDIPTLESAVAKTRAFEKKLTLKFQGIRVDTEEPTEQVAVHQSASEAIKAKHLQRKADEQKKAKASNEQAGSAGSPQRDYKFTWISACFERYVLELYAQHEEEEMRKYLDEILEAETWQPSTEHGNVLQSAGQLVLYIRESFTRCVRLSTGENFLALTGVWSKHLTGFAGRLEATLGQRRGVAEGDYTAVCLIINSAAYWRDRSLELEDQVLERIDELYRQTVKVELAPTFVAVVGKGIKQLVRMVGAEMDPHFQSISHINWANITAVGDVSEYASRLDGLIADRTKQIASYLSRDYIRVFCEKLGEFVSSRFSAQIYRCKRISIQGGQQLLQDAQHVRAALLSLAELGKFTDTQRAGYIRTIKTEMNKTENVLKIVLQPPHSGDLAEQYANHVTNPSVPDFLRLMEIKGLKREEVQHMVAALQQKGLPATEVVAPEDDESARKRDIVDMFKDLVPRTGFKFFN
eukprot:TRINITY_DN95983_c0_g1_i1.p1 TRINITY_DN95983_c0_g1~~TRINITY_DN95983_c0_g1_i1.p1  ORF type:complete len:806 (+),score=176.61 TRINITY_DN95983_c0_g1_i1:844-3261(+)